VNKATAQAHLIEVKLALARKHERLAKSVHSAPRRKTLLNHAARFRQQATNLTKS
jgi:hypothetical protein